MEYRYVVQFIDFTGCAAGRVGLLSDNLDDAREEADLRAGILGLYVDVLLDNDTYAV